jgi:aminoglycoside phosphotransferase (APT) family kinase protein
MAISRRNPERLRRALLPWLHARIPDAEEIVASLPGMPPSGGSSETFFVDATVRERGSERRESWVLRIEATDHRIYEQPSIARQYQTMKTIGETHSAPVPRMLWYEDDKNILGESFFLMERVFGTVPRDLYHSDSEGLFARSSPAEREAMWLSAVKAMAGIHSVNAQEYAFLDRADWGRSALDQEIAIWDSYSRWSGVPPQPIQERARLWLDDNMPAVKPHGLAWGDARLGNMIFKNNACTAVLDWEIVSLSGAETDLGWWLFYDWFAAEGLGQGASRLEGIPTATDTVKLWEDLAGRRANDIEWFVVFATWRFSMIRDRAVYLSRVMGPEPINVPDPDPVLVYLERLTSR